jgi:hypothetical protein
MVMAVNSPTGGGPTRFKSQTGTLGDWSTEAPDEYDWSGSDDGFFPVTRLRQQYLDYLTAKVQEYEEQKLSRHYYHGAQYTPEEIRILRERRQPIITINRLGRKIDSIAGLILRLRQDPKAYPRNPKNGDGAEVATQCIRTVLESNEWYFLDNYAVTQAGIEGIAGVELKLIPGDHGDPDLGMDFIFGDDFFYDPRSFKPDFSDARFLGIAKWLDVEAAVELFPDREEEIRSLMVETGFDLTTHADREFKWVYVNEHRVRLVEHWYKHKGMWYWAFYCSFILLAQGESPFRDERNRPCPRFIMFSAAVDHDGDRYGFTRNLKGPQDEINARRSKALHISNVTRLTLQKGSVDDVETTRREAARPDGVIEYNPGFEPPAGADKTNDLQAHMLLLQHATAEIDGFANVNPALMTQDGKDEHSGVAINLLQKAGIAEIGTFLRNYRAWKIRVYRAIWNTIQTTWQAERWIRVTDNDGVKQFLAVNKLGLNQWGQPEITNAVGSLDVDIILDEGPDVANLMQDAWEVLSQMPPGTVPPDVLIELMPLPNSVKKSILEKMQQAQQAAAQNPDPKTKVEMMKGQVAMQQGQQKMQIAAQQGQVKLQAEQIRAQAEAQNAAQDQAQTQLEFRIQQERENAERQKLAMEMEQSRREHEFKMAELAAQHSASQAEHAEQRKTSQVQHAAKRKAATQSKTKAA